MQTTARLEGDRQPRRPMVRGDHETRREEADIRMPQGKQLTARRAKACPPRKIRGQGKTETRSASVGYGRRSASDIGELVHDLKAGEWWVGRRSAG